MFDSVATTRGYGFSVSHPSVRINHNLSSHLRRQPSSTSSSSSSSSTSSTLPTSLDTPQQLRSQQYSHPLFGHSTRNKDEKETENEKKENMNEAVLIEEKEEEDGPEIEYQQLLDEEDEEEGEGQCEENEVTNTIPIEREGEGDGEDSDGDSSFDFLDDSKNASEDGDGVENENGERLREPRGPHGGRQSVWSKKAERMFRALLEQGREKELCAALEALLCQGERGKEGGKEVQIIEEEKGEREGVEVEEDEEEEEEEEEEASEKLMEGILDIEILVKEVGVRLLSLLEEAIGVGGIRRSSSPITLTTHSTPLNNNNSSFLKRFDDESLRVITDFTKEMVQLRGLGSKEVLGRLESVILKHNREVILKSKEKLLSELSDILYDDLILCLLAKDVEKSYQTQIADLQRQIQKLQEKEQQEIRGLSAERTSAGLQRTFSTTPNTHR